MKKQLLHYLLFLGNTINAIITDGFKGLHKAFKEHPIQLCYFHQRKTMNRYLTKNPKLDNTTNAIDGGVFSPMKKLMNVHNGFSKSLKLKITFSNF